MKFDEDGKLNEVYVSCNAHVTWGAELDVSHLNITKQDIESGLTKDQWVGFRCQMVDTPPLIELNKERYDEEQKSVF